MIWDMERLPMQLKTKILLLAIVVAGIILLPLVVSESSDTGTVTIEINDNIQIDVTNTPMAFNLDVGIADQNGTDGATAPFGIENTGSVTLDVSTCATWPNWASDTNDVNAYKWIADNNEASSCDTIMPSDSNWTDFNMNGQSMNSTQICEGLNLESNQDLINVGIYLRPPSDEPSSSSLSSTVTFYIAQDTTGADDAVQSPCT